MAILGFSLSAQSQFVFDVEVQPSWTPREVVMPPSPLKHQVLFVGGNDMVQTTATYGNEAGAAPAKQWHDFIGFTPDPDSEDLGWISVNHEMVSSDDKIGDGGGMTVFKVRRNPATDLLEIVDQELPDGRKGQFFNVDFVNTVGETGMNCGGIVGPDGRIWTAEEWWQSGTDAAFRNKTHTISSDLPGDFNGQTVELHENLNYMVEIDPKTARAIRKQYNWGRQPLEGGTIMPDNKTVYLGADATPGLFTRFVADEAGDFTKGKIYAYKHDAQGEPWIEIENGSLENMLNFSEIAISKGATMFNRLEWVTNSNGKVYMTETGRDGIGSSFSNGAKAGGVLDYHWVEPVKMRHPELANKPEDAILEFVKQGKFNDYYGRVLEFDPETGIVRTYLEGGPYFPHSPAVNDYPENHLSNPDGLNILNVAGKSFMVICEDLNGRSHGRVPAGINNSTCEMYLLDMSIEAPTVEDLTRVSIVPMGAEVTGACPTPDGKTLLVNSQHPSSDNPYPYNNSLTYAITGWDVAVSAVSNIKEIDLGEGFKVWPNPVSRFLKFNKVVDAAIYDFSGKRMKVFRGMESIDVSDLAPGTYYLRTSEGDSQKLIIQ